jgi:hypothetical protein
METARGDIDEQWNFRAKDYDGETKVVQRLELFEAYETLGVLVAPDGNSDAQYAKLLTKATKWAERLRTSTLRDQETACEIKKLLRLSRLLFLKP